MNRANTESSGPALESRVENAVRACASRSPVEVKRAFGRLLRLLGGDNEAAIDAIKLCFSDPGMKGRMHRARMDGEASVRKAAGHFHNLLMYRLRADGMNQRSG